MPTPFSLAFRQLSDAAALTLPLLPHEEALLTSDHLGKARMASRQVVKKHGHTL